MQKSSPFSRCPGLSGALLTLAPDVHPEQGELAHVLVMQHVSKELLDSFIADMKKDFEK